MYAQPDPIYQVGLDRIERNRRRFSSHELFGESAAQARSLIARCSRSSWEPRPP